jgi:hypothetical protein
LLACAGAIWMNPYTDTSFWRFMLETVILDRPGMIGWQPLSLLSPAALVLHLFVLLIGIGLFRAARSGAGLGGVEPFAWALLLSALFFGERYQRLVPIPMMVAYVFFSDLMARALTVTGGGWIGIMKRAARKGRAPALWASIALFAGACTLRLQSSGLALDYGPYPVSALEWLANHRPGGKLLVDFDAGGFALWRLYPRFNVSLDGRHEEVYPQATVRAVEEALDPGRPHHAESLESVLPDFILVRGRYDQADPARGFGSRWQPVYQDEQYAILETAGGPSPAVAGPGTGTVDVWMPRF